MKYQLKQGIKTEKEHKNTYNLIEKNKINNKNKFYESIAKDHIKEDKNYYTKLKKAGL